MIAGGRRLQGQYVRARARLRLPARVFKRVRAPPRALVRARARVHAAAFVADVVLHTATGPKIGYNDNAFDA